MSFIMASSAGIQGLQQVQAGLVRRVAKLYEEQGQAIKVATIDQDATIIESHKQSAQAHYEGGRGYQPMVAQWAEADLVVADEFRDGNVPARQAPLTCARWAFAALPETIRTRYFRGDSACHENELIGWLKHPDRQCHQGMVLFTRRTDRSLQKVPAHGGSSGRAHESLSVQTASALLRCPGGHRANPADLESIHLADPSHRFHLTVGRKVIHNFGPESR